VRPRVFKDLAQLEAAVGEPLGSTGWMRIEQHQVNAFAELTGDSHWIHVDVKRGKDSQFGGTIAHGYMTLAMLTRFADELYRIDAGTVRLNYGVDRVRFPSPLLVGARIRATPKFTSLVRGDAGGRLETDWVVESDESSKPICVATATTLIVS
jgi:acyl dehydratase